ncbi:MAG: MFS transporter [Propionibacteriaceae bacterium]|jgi:MFS family permease|nr:MFS transporter [Propionibacteriaceae bacterium]
MDRKHWRCILVPQTILTQGGYASIRLMAGYRALDQGADLPFLGVVVSALALPALLISLPAGRLSDRIGGTKLILTGIVVTAASIMFTVFLPGLPMLLVAAAGSGLGGTLVVIGNQTYVARVGRDSPDGAFGILSASASLGQMTGPALVAFAATLDPGSDLIHPNTVVGFCVCALLYLLGIPFSIFEHRIERGLPIDRIQPGQNQRKNQARDVLRKKGLWRAVLVSGAVLVTIDLMYSFVPVWATAQGIGATTVGFLLSLRAGVSVISRVGLAKATALIGRRAVLIISIAGAAIGAFAFPFASTLGAIVVMIVMGFGLGTPQPLTMSWVVSLTSPAQHGTALGLRLTANNLAQLCFPALISTLASPFGVLGIFWSTGLLLCSSLLLVAPRDPDPHPGGR